MFAHELFILNFVGYNNILFFQKSIFILDF
jgi:hypothetical protein